MRVSPGVRWITVVVLAAAQAAAKTPAPAGGVAFGALLADPKEPQFFAAFLWERSPRLAPRLGSVGFGQTIGVASGGMGQGAIAAARFSPFNLARPTAGPMNTGYRHRPPVTHPPTGLTTRAQPYHHRTD